MNRRRRQRTERGSVIVFTTIWVTAVLMGVAVLNDGARLVNAHREAEGITVTVSFNQSLGMLRLLGLVSRQVNATASARPAQGITAEGT